MYTLPSAQPQSHCRQVVGPPNPATCCSNVHWCEICKSYLHPHIMLLCDSCNSGWHTTCFVPPLTELPTGDWFHLICSAVGRVPDTASEPPYSLVAPARDAQPEVHVSSPIGLSLPSAPSSHSVTDFHSSAPQAADDHSGAPVLPPSTAAYRRRVSFPLAPADETSPPLPPPQPKRRSAREHKPTARFAASHDV